MESIFWTMYKLAVISRRETERPKDLLRNPSKASYSNCVARVAERVYAEMVFKGVSEGWLASAKFWREESREAGLYDRLEEVVWMKLKKNWQEGKLEAGVEACCEPTEWKCKRNVKLRRSSGGGSWRVGNSDV